MELEALLERCRAGDEVAWEALVRRFQSRVFGLTYHYLRDREEAREVAQETFIRVYRGLSGFDGSGSFLAWMTRIARNCAFDRLRRLQRLPAYAGVEVAENSGGADAAAAPDAIAEEHERYRQLYLALDHMTAINREMILLKEIQGLKQREIADLLSIPLGTVKARSNRARIELATRMLELDPSFGA